MGYFDDIPDGSVTAVARPSPSAPPPHPQTDYFADIPHDYFSDIPDTPDPASLPDAHDDAPSWFSTQWDYLKGLPAEVNNRLGQGEFKAAGKLLRGAQWGIEKLYGIGHDLTNVGDQSDLEKSVPLLGASADWLENFADKNYRLDPKYKNDITASLAQMVGDLGTTLGFGKALTVPGAFAISSGQSGAEEAAALGHPEQADTARIKQGMIGALAGGSFPEAETLARASENPFREIVRSAAHGGAVTGGQTAAINVAALDYDPNRSMAAGVGPATAAGVILGGAMRAAPELLTAVRGELVRTPVPGSVEEVSDPNAVAGETARFRPPPIPAPGPESETMPATQSDVVGFPVVPVPTDQIASRPELMQFKRMDDTSTGENAADQITAPYDQLKAGNLLLWQPINREEYGLGPSEQYIVANGHHRDAAAKGQNVETQNAQIIREANGYSAGDARSLAAEANIADGKGTIYDQAKFLREQAATFGPDAALARAGQIGARGRKAATIATAAGSDLFTSFVNEQITPDQTEAISAAAPGNEGLQRLGILRAVKGDSANDIANFLQAVRARGERVDTPQQADLFASDDAAIRQAEKMAVRAGTIQREIAEQISAISGAAKRPEKARALGVNIDNPGDVQARLTELQQLRERARNWMSDDQLRPAVLRSDKPPAAIIEDLQSEPAAVSVEDRQGNYGATTRLLEPAGEAAARAAPEAIAPSLSDLVRRFSERSETVQQNRETLARKIEAAGTDAALNRADVLGQRAQEYAKETIRQFAEQARRGVVPSRPHLPLYRADYQRNMAAYGRAAEHAFNAVTRGLRDIPKQAIFASGSTSPRLRSNEKGTGDLFQESDAPFNLIGEKGIDYSARQAADSAAAEKLKAAAEAQDKQQPKLFAQGAASPSPGPLSRRIMPGPPKAALAIVPLQSWWKQKTLGIRKVLAPQTIDDHARLVANIIRDYSGQVANHIAQADAQLAEWRRSFDHTPVPANWKYKAGEPLPRNYAFMARSERGGVNLSPDERALKTQLDRMFAEAVDEVHRVKPEALKSLIQDYFPHLWKDPERAKQVFAEVVGNRGLEGSKAFLRQRTLAYIEEGLKAGLRPVSDNPIDIVLTKLHELRRFVAAQDILNEAKQIGARKFVYIFEKPPEGWAKVNDPTSDVHGPPFVTVPEAFDEQVRVKTQELLDSLGIRSERTASLGGRRWGTYETGGGGIHTKFAGPLSVLWHELGHGLQERYGWIDHILGNVNHASSHPLAVELRSLADLRFEGQDPTKSFRKYVRTKDEKAAVMLEAYLHAPEKMEAVAPTIFEAVKQFIADRPELHPIDDLRPSLALGSSKQRIDIGGPVVLGHYYMPEGAAAVLNNYLSPGLQRFGLVRNLRTMSHAMNAAQLGFSAFHAGFTSIDAAVSSWAVGLQYLSQGKILLGASRIAASPLAPVANYFTGKAIQNAMLRPGSSEVKMLGFTRKLSAQGQAAADEIGKLAVQAGLRATIDPFWKTQITRNMLRAWREGGVKGYAGTVLRLPFAISEQLMRPIAEVLVVRQKLGVFAGMAMEAMDRLGPNAEIHAVRDAMARVADATEDRMGQMTYDNLFYNRMVKDAALLGFRAYGWTFGKYRGLLGGIADTVNTPSRIARGEPVLTARMAYLIALPMFVSAVGSIMNFIMTGQGPQDWKDAVMPRTGKMDVNGNPVRLSLPTYLKDFLSDWRDVPDLKKMIGSFSHKLNPLIATGIEILRNADYYNTKVFNEDDPWLQQQAEKVLHVVKSAVPFSVVGAQRLSKSNPGLQEYLLPFLGFVTAKQALTMTPAQNRAAELYRETLPVGARTLEQANHSKLLAELVHDFQTDDPDTADVLADAVQKGRLLPHDLHTVKERLRTTPLQYQVKRLGLDRAMKVWDLANESERDELRPLILKKFRTTKNISPDQKLTFWRAFNEETE